MDKNISGLDLLLDEVIELGKELGDVLAFGIQQGVNDMLNKAIRVHDLIHSTGCCDNCHIKRIYQD